MKPSKQSVVYDNSWFQVIESSDNATGELFYGLECPDYVHVVALTKDNDIVFVRQHRPVINKSTLELPGGHVDSEQTPEEAARNELYEETGYKALSLQLLGVLHTDVGRLRNKLWCFLSEHIEKDKDWLPEDGIEVVHHKITSITSLIQSGIIDNAYDLACFMQASCRLKNLGPCNR